MLAFLKSAVPSLSSRQILATAHKLAVSSILYISSTLRKPQSEQTMYLHTKYGIHRKLILIQLLIKIHGKNITNRTFKVGKDIIVVCGRECLGKIMDGNVENTEFWNLLFIIKYQLKREEHHKLDE